MEETAMAEVSGREILSTVDALTTRALVEPVPESREAKREKLVQHLQVTLESPLGRRVAPLGRDPEGAPSFADIRELGQIVGAALGQGLATERAGEKSALDKPFSACDTAFVNGLASITVGAIIGGPAGAAGGFVLAVIDTYMSCP